MQLVVAAVALAFSPSSPPLLSNAAARACVDPRAARTCVRMNFFADLLQQVDDFLDDATMRRMGNGAKFYGKRKSNFYGEDDSMRKKDPRQFDPEEDWRGPGGGSYFVLSKERDAQGRPLGFLNKKQAREQARQEEDAKWETLAAYQQALDEQKSEADADGSRAS